MCLVQYPLWADSDDDWLIIGKTFLRIFFIQQVCLLEQILDGAGQGPPHDISRV